MSARAIVNQLLSEEGEVVPHQQLVIRVGRKIVPVASFAAASEWWMALRDHTGVSNREAPRVEVLDADTGQAVARVAYNGRIFDLSRTTEHPHGREIEVPHFTPLAKMDYSKHRVPPREPSPDERPPIDV